MGEAGRIRAIRQKLFAAATSLWLILLAGTICRAGYALYQVHITPSAALASAPFEQETGNIAMSLATGKGFSSPTRQNTGPTAWLPPVYPFILAAIFRIFGVFTLHAFYAAAALNIVFSVATCVPIYFAGMRIGGAGTASLAAWLWTLFPNAIIIPFQWIWDTSLTAFLAAAILWATLALAESERIQDWCLYGLLWGFALLTNPVVGAALPFLLGWLIWRQPPSRAVFKRAAVALSLVVLCCIPWTARNYVQFHRWIPLRSNFPFDLWMGNNRVFDEHAPVNARITRYGEARLYGQLGEAAFMHEKWYLATEFIRTHKRLEIRLTWWRALSFWLGSFRPLQDFENADSAWIKAIFLANLLTALGSAIGLLVLVVRRNPFTLLVAVFVLVVPLLYYITHASLRYRHPIDPMVLLLTALAITRASPPGAAYAMPN
jgi:4-amino-4-deoxy-L-arabinose transferase-like glycosyltransferase